MRRVLRWLFARPPYVPDGVSTTPRWLRVAIWWFSTLIVAGVILIPWIRGDDREIGPALAVTAGWGWYWYRDWLPIRPRR